MDEFSDLRVDRKNGTSGIMSGVSEAKCPTCGKCGCRLHWNVTMVKNPATGKREQKRLFYCDCACHMGVVTGWYEKPEDAIVAWQKGIWVEDKNA